MNNSISSKISNTRNCPVCHTNSDTAKLFLENSIDPSKLSEFSFASRKTPEFMSHKLVQCSICDLVYANQPPSEDELAHAYHTADYDSSEEANDAAIAYIAAIRSTLNSLKQKDSVLEIGTGTGVFLEHLAREGFSELVGVEPSVSAIAAAPAHRKLWIRQGMFDENDFLPNSFDLICCFMTMEHVRDPYIIGQAALRLLKPGGAFVTVTHDYRGFVNRLLGKRSPIIDIEHMQLFSEKSLNYLFKNIGYSNISINPFVNRYAMQYWMRLAPLPIPIKNTVSTIMTKTNIHQTKVGINVGNLITSGFKTI